MRTALAVFPVPPLAERRENDRFPVCEDVSYSIMTSRPQSVTGSGKTLNFSSGGILFTTNGRLPVGRRVQLSVNWPAQLGGRCLLKFVAEGVVVRSDDHQAAVRIQKYQFKTRGLAPQRVH